MLIITISKDFSETPGGRYISEGNFSGEEFREKILRKAFEKAKQTKQKLTINLDGGYGYPTSFLEEAFGGLARLYGSSEVLNTLKFISEDEPPLIHEIESYILSTNNKKK